MDCKNKFNNFKNSAFALRRLNDKLCREHGLSVIENPKRRARPRGEAGAVKYGNSYKEKLRKAIDYILPESVSWDDFLARMRAEGYEIKTGKDLAFRAPGQERFTRAARLGEDYEKDALRRRVGKQKPEPARSSKKTQRTAGRKINLLIDIQAKLEAGKGKGYERWAKIYNLKEAARTLNFLTENGITEYEELAERTAEAEKKYDAAALRMKQLEGRMAEAAQLKMHIINYSKTRGTYQQYRKAVNKTRFRAEHQEAIEKHEASKAAFDKLEGKGIPKVAQLSAQYTALLAEKKDVYEEYKALKKEMLEIKNAKQNIDRLLGMEDGRETKKENQMLD